MSYSPLPMHEQVVRRKPLPKWWNSPFGKLSQSEIIEILGNSRELCTINETNIEEEILVFLSKNGPMTREKLLPLLGRRGQLVSPALRILFRQGKITFDNVGKMRKWRIAGPDDKTSKPLVFEIKGSIQRHLFAVMNQEKYNGKWLTLKELSTAINKRKDSRVTTALNALFSMGFIERTEYVNSIEKPFQVKTHPWMYRVANQCGESYSEEKQNAIDSVEKCIRTHSPNGVSAYDIETETGLHEVTVGRCLSKLRKTSKVSFIFDKARSNRRLWVPDGVQAEYKCIPGKRTGITAMILADLNKNPWSRVKAISARLAENKDKVRKVLYRLQVSGRIQARPDPDCPTYFVYSI